jgi:hypothetical protein
MSLVLQQRRAVLDLERDVLHPTRRVRVAAHLRPRRQLEEREHVAVACVHEHVHVRIWFLGRRHFVFGDRQHEVHVQHLLVPEHRFLRVAAPVGDVMNLLDLHGFSRCATRL